MISDATKELQRLSLGPALTKGPLSNCAHSKSQRRLKFPIKRRRLPFWLPQELWELIIHELHLARVAQYNWCRQPIGVPACAVVCRAWTPYAQSLLFSAVRIRDCTRGKEDPIPHDYPIYRLSEVLHGSEYLSRLVRHLHLDMRYPTTGDHEMFRCLELLTRIETLEVNDGWLADQSSYLVSMLRTLVALPTIRRIILLPTPSSGVYGHLSNIQWSTICDFLAHAGPNLASLALPPMADRKEQSPSAVLSRDHPIGPPRTKIALKHLSVVTEDDLRQIRLSPMLDLTGLREFKCTRYSEGTTSEFTKLLNKNGDSLTKLRIACPRSWGPQVHVPMDLSSLRAVREITLRVSHTWSSDIRVLESLPNPTTLDVLRLIGGELASARIAPGKLDGGAVKRSFETDRILAEGHVRMSTLLVVVKSGAPESSHPNLVAKTDEMHWRKKMRKEALTWFPQLRSKGVRIQAILEEQT